MSGRRKDRKVLADAVTLVAAGGSIADVLKQLVERHECSEKTARRYVAMVEAGHAPIPNSQSRDRDALIPVAVLDHPAPPGPRVGDETLDQYRLRWARRLEGWVARVEAELEEGIVIGYKEHGEGELTPILLNRPAAYGRMVRVVERIHKLVGADAPQQIHVTGAVAHGHLDLGPDPLSMSPAERARERAQLLARKKELASGSEIDVECSEEKLEGADE